MSLAVIDPCVFVAGVFWRHEPHLCLKAWLRGLITPVLTEEMRVPSARVRNLVFGFR